MRQVMWQKGGIASTHMTEMHAYGYSLKDTTRYAAGGLNFRSASRLALSTLCDPFCGLLDTLVLVAKSALLSSSLFHEASKV